MNAIKLFKRSYPLLFLIPLVVFIATLRNSDFTNFYTDNTTGSVKEESRIDGVLKTNWLYMSSAFEEKRARWRGGVSYFAQPPLEVGDYVLVDCTGSRFAFGLEQSDKNSRTVLLNVIIATGHYKIKAQESILIGGQILNWKWEANSGLSLWLDSERRINRRCSFYYPVGETFAESFVQRSREVKDWP
jgi:hypothetical protein